MAYKKKFNGKDYLYRKTMGKTNAKRFSKLYRKKGWNVRVIKESNGWAIYMRKKDWHNRLSGSTR